MLHYSQFLPAILSAVLFLIVGVFCFIGSQRALERSPKSLDWIKRHGLGGYPFAREAFPAQRADWLGVFGVAVFALVTAMFTTVVRSLYIDSGSLRSLFASRSLLSLGFTWMGKLFAPYALISIVIAVLGAICMYFLLQRLFGSTLVSACGSLLAAASFVGAHSAGAMLTAALLMLVLWLNAPSERLFPAELLYYAACLLMGLTVALRPQLLPMVLLVIGLHLYKHFLALRRDVETPGTLVLAVLLSLLVWLLALVLFAAGRMLLFYGFSLTITSQLLQQVGPVQLLLRLCRGALRSLTHPLLRSRVLLPLLDAPLLALGGFGAVSAVLMWTRRKDARSKLILPILGVLVLVWLLSDCSVLSVGLTLTAGLLFSNFERGGKRLPVILVTVGGVLFYLCFYFLAHYLPWSVALLERLS